MNHEDDYALYREQDDYAVFLARCKSEERYARAIIWIIALIGIAALVWAAVGEARAHSFYEAFCCSGNSVTGDCQPIPDEAVKPIPGGFQITLRPGDHPLVTRVHVFKIEASKARPSPDGRHHACLYPTEDTLRCFYTPPMGF